MTPKRGGNKMPMKMKMGGKMPMAQKKMAAMPGEVPKHLKPRKG